MGAGTWEPEVGSEEADPVGRDWKSIPQIVSEHFFMYLYPYSAVIFCWASSDTEYKTMSCCPKLTVSLVTAAQSFFLR